MEIRLARELCLVSRLPDCTRTIASRSYGIKPNGVEFEQPKNKHSSCPVVGDVTVTLTFPKYTGKDRRILPNSTGNFTVPKGTKVAISATTVDPVQSAFIMVDDKEQAAALTKNRHLTATFLIERQLDWRFGVQGTDGGRSLESKGRRITIRPDKVPAVQLKEPNKDQELKNIRDVPVEFVAQDDYGLKRVNVAIALANDLENPVRIEQGGVTGRRFRGLTRST